MAKNPHSKHQLDVAQIQRKVFDPENDAFRMVLEEVALSLSAAHGDSVVSVPNSLTQKISVDSSTSGDLMPPVSVVGMKSFNFVINGSDDLASKSSCTLLLSPSDTDDVWVKAASIVVMPGIESSGVVQALARRLKVCMDSPLNSGSFDLYILAQSV
jgi:hypothetical protein